MSTKTFLSSAFRQCKSCLSQQHATLSTSSRAQALKRVQSPSSSSRILGLADSSSPRHNSTDLALKLSESDRGYIAQRKARQEETAKKLADQATSESYMRMMPRRWKVGDVYAPRDLSPSEIQKWRRSKVPKVDVLDVLGVNPLDLYQNFSIISEYVTVMGRIKHSNETGLRAVNQRKMAKAIRRAIGLGIHPSVHRYPEVLKWVNAPYGVKSYAPKGSSKKSEA